MEHTEYHQLCLWDPEDRILREDFNSDNAKTEAALADLTEAVAGCGNCKIEYGSYAGSGNYSSAHPNSLTFSGQPLFVLILNSFAPEHALMVRGSGWSFVATSDTQNSGNIFVNWATPNAVSWYASTVAAQMNTSGSTYFYIALLATE